MIQQRLLPIPTLLSERYGIWSIRTMLLSAIALVAMVLSPAVGMAQPQQQVFTASGTFLVPANVTSITVECYGAGGGGGYVSSNTQAGGGGGGAFGGRVLAVTPGQTFTVTRGLGGSGGSGTNSGTPSFFVNAANPAAILVRGAGGIGAANNNAAGGAGGSVANSIGDVRNAGGNGGEGSAIGSGGGGGGGGTTAAGGNGTLIAAGGGGAANGGNGGDGGGSLLGSYTGAAGASYGGGGSGATRFGFSGSRSGGNGANGAVIVRWLTPCSGTPSPGTTTGPSSTTGCAPITVGVQNVPTQSGFTYQWESAPSAAGPWVAISGATNSTYVANPNESTAYRCVVSCQFGSSAITTPREVTVTPCTIVGTGTGVAGTGDSYPNPLQDYFEAQRAQYLYDATSLDNVPIGSTITHVGWNVPTARNIASHLIEGYTIKLANSALTDLSLTTWESVPTTNYGPTNYSYPVNATGQLMFPLSTTITYAGGSLLMEVCGGANVAFSDNPAVQWTTGLGYTASHTWRADNTTGCGTAATAHSGDAFARPNLVVYFIPPPPCDAAPDAGVVSILSNPFGNGCADQELTLNSDALNLATGVEYEWQVNAVNPALPFLWQPSPGVGETTTTHTTLPFTDDQIGSTVYYRLKATCTETGDESFSDFATVEIFELPEVVLTSDPPEALICQSGSVELSVSGSDIADYLWAPATNLSPSVTASVVTVTPPATRTYSVTATNASGCQNAEGIQVRVEQSPQATTTTTAPATLCEDGSIQLNTVIAPAFVPATDFSNPVTRSGNAGSLSLAIPDATFFGVIAGAPVSSPITVVGSNFAPLRIQVQITTSHPVNSDLEFWLQGPANCGGMQISTRIGGSTGNYSAAQFVAPAQNLPNPPQDNLNGTYNAQGSLFSGVANPVVTLGPLSACPVNGTWSLFVRDVANPNFGAGGSAGSLTNWQIAIDEPGTGNYTHEVIAGPGTYGTANVSGTSNSSSQISISDLTAPGGNLSWTVRSTAPSGCFVDSQVNANIAVVEPPTDAIAGADQTICVTSTSAALGANTPTAGTGAWSVVSGGTGTFSSASNPNATFTHTNGVGPVVLRWTISNPPCAATFADMSITITPQPTVSDAGAAQVICSFPGEAVMAANTPAIGVGNWAQTGGPVSATIVDPTSTSTNITGMTSGGAYTFTWSISNSPCAASVSSVTINATEATAWYLDQDIDTYGDPANSVLACTQPAGYVANNLDDCPTVFGLVGSNCDANPSPNAFQFGQLNSNCDCVPVATTESLVLVVQADANPTQISYEITDPNNASIVFCGGTVDAGAANQFDAFSCELTVGCYRLRVFDSGGDGITAGNNGGYVLRYTGTVQPLQDNLRVIDNAGNFLSGSVSAIGNGPGAFCLPLGPTKPLFHHRDRMDFVSGEYLVCEENAAVSAQWVPNGANTVQSTTTGYEFWLFDPNGSFSYRRFRNHATSDNFGNIGATRACHMKINNWAAAQHAPADMLLNVRIRTRVNGVNGDWGPAYRFKIDAVRAQCPLTKLNDFPGNEFLSCNSTRAWGTGNWIHARPVSGANKYQFRFRNTSEGFNRVITSNTYFLQLNWATSPLESGKVYDVDVRASKDGGATWCTAFIPPALTAQWGEMCKLTIVGGNAQGGSQNLAVDSEGNSLMMYPNPNRGDQLSLNIDMIDEGVPTIAVDFYDMLGHRAAARIIPTQGDHLQTVIDLKGELAAGVYMVHITAGDKTYTERLVVQH